MEDDRSYYARRAGAEWRAAALARDAETRHLHFELAEMLHVKASLQRPPGKAPTSAGRWFAAGTGAVRASP